MRQKHPLNIKMPETTEDSVLINKKFAKKMRINICKEVPNEVLSSILMHMGFTQIKKMLLVSKEYLNKIRNCYFLWKNKCEPYGLPFLRSNTEFLSIIRKNKYLKQSWKKGTDERRCCVVTNQTDITQMVSTDKYVISSSDDQTIKIFSYNGIYIRTLIGHLGGVWCFCSDGKYLISGSTDKSIRIWDISTGWTIKVLTGHRSTVRCLKIYEKLIISGSRDSDIRVWNYEGDCLHILSGHSASVRCMDINDKFLLSGSYDGDVILWDYKNGKTIKKMARHSNRVYSVVLGKNYIASGSQDATINLSKIDGVLIAVLRSHRLVVAWLFLVYGIKEELKYEKYIITSGADGYVCKWDIMTGNLIYKISENEQITSMFVICDLLIVSTVYNVKMYDLKSGKFIRFLKKNVSGVYKVIGNDRNIIIGFSEDVTPNIEIISNIVHLNKKIKLTL
ncbi:WD40 repeat-containing protein [Hamiltosporidium tvaerminnensis]|uniref:WD40 repeat-containing protein n=1 Tax=Hamiltosporidium tvaerminnensis TaxID=1176355 RepID=A0A4Q9M1V9_9MICR|nr:hypothetical protein LUQ84_001190 [Hamiltosporidium tvaerminnensis]TBU03959.1 WD40 repeat-containing protein [Hamiltosporidium tvaerminnensis]TBU18872.1 WD40 repeat-containing protein [Hamiltosporidium tvaerminnensis]